MAFSLRLVSRISIPSGNTLPLLLRISIAASYDKRITSATWHILANQYNVNQNKYVSRSIPVLCHLLGVADIDATSWADIETKIFSRFAELAVNQPLVIVTVDSDSDHEAPVTSEAADVLVQFNVWADSADLPALLRSCTKGSHATYASLPSEECVLALVARDSCIELLKKELASDACQYYAGVFLFLFVNICVYRYPIVGFIN
jgi:hypothetical protein